MSWPSGQSSSGSAGPPGTWAVTKASSQPKPASASAGLVQCRAPTFPRTSLRSQPSGQRSGTSPRLKNDQKSAIVLMSGKALCPIRPFSKGIIPEKAKFAFSSTSKVIAWSTLCRSAVRSWNRHEAEKQTKIRTAQGSCRQAEASSIFERRKAQTAFSGTAPPSPFSAAVFRCSVISVRVPIPTTSIRCSR